MRPSSLPLPRLGQRGSFSEDAGETDVHLNTATSIRGVELLGNDKDNAQTGQEDDVRGGTWGEKREDGEALCYSSSSAEIESRFATFPGSGGEGNKHALSSSLRAPEQAMKPVGDGNESLDHQAKSVPQREMVRGGNTVSERRLHAVRLEDGNSHPPGASDEKRNETKKSLFGRLWTTSRKRVMPAGKTPEGAKGRAQSIWSETGSSKTPQQREEDRIKGIADKVGGLRAKLPLSKLKIVIGKCCGVFALSVLL